MLNVPDLTWMCHVCADERLDPCISVYSKKQGYVQVNVRYCNDRPSCLAGAKIEAHLRIHKIMGKKLG